MANTKRSRGDTATRLLRIITYFERNSSGLSVEDIHEKLENDGYTCSLRTIYRDLEVISNAHFPLININDETREKHVYKFNRTTALNINVHFDYHEILALFLAKESLKALKGSPLIDHIISFSEKIENLLGTSVAKELSNLSEYVAFKSAATWHAGVSRETLDTLYDASYNKMIVEVEYRAQSGTNKNQVSKRRLGPETLYFADGGAYFIARDLKDNKIKYYSLSRIFSALMTTESYDSIEKFDIEAFVKDSFGVLSSGEVCDVELLVAEPMASYVSERKWHESQRVTRVDGGVQIKIRVKVNDELIRWILSLGPTATVKAPQDLRDAVVLNAQDVINNYKAIKAAS